MAMVEKLILQIFERKEWIIENVKLQTLGYDQYLASRCIIDGIAPPPWLWRSSFQPQTLVLRELKKEVLFSSLLLPLTDRVPHSTSSRHLLYEIPTVTADNGGSCIEDFAAKVATSVRRETLADITENFKAPAVVTEAEIFPDRCSLDFVDTEFSSTGTFDREKQEVLVSHDNSMRRYENKAKENQNLVIEANGFRKATKSLDKGCSKPKLSGQTSLGKGILTFSKRNSKHNKIVPNVTSFVPLVQQKQLIGIITGKRDVKVKALEVAKGAKLLAEKKENERIMKKEAFKCERARAQQENLRQLELQTKMKEEERKKKRDDMASRQRQRVEDEMKEKERKRRLAKDAQRQQREHAKNLRSKKEERENKSEAKDERALYEKISDNDLRKLNKREVHAHDNCKIMSLAEPRNAITLKSDVRKASIVLEECESTSGPCSDMKFHTFIGGSSCMQPHNEDEVDGDLLNEEDGDSLNEEDGDLLNNELFPSWASVCFAFHSEHSMALAISSQQSIDPVEIFLTKSFCNIDEVLLP